MVKKDALLAFSFQGFKHKKVGLPNQDYASFYEGKDYYLIGVADGHGSDLYFRSHLGSRYAILAAFEELKNFNQENEFNVKTAEQFKIKLLSRWHKLIANDLNRNPFKSEETIKLNDKDFAKLKLNSSLAYGTTLTCALINLETIFIFSIGDSSAMYYDNDLKPYPLFVSDDENESNTNATNSMCEEDAFYKLHHAFLLTNELSSIALATDGAINPYQRFEDYQYYVPLMFLKEKFLNNNPESEMQLESFIKKLADEKGTGDDVSFAIFYKNQINTDNLDVYSLNEVQDIIKKIEFKHVSHDWIFQKYNQLPIRAKRRLFYYFENKNLGTYDLAIESKFQELINVGIDPISAMIIIERNNLKGG